MNPCHSDSKPNALGTELRRLMIEFNLFVIAGPICVAYKTFPKDYGKLYHHQKHSY